ncbi:MAG: dienelactone hydrolase family protein [Leptolyngbyaceae cyanobacterium SL_5_9]|nr:dienelactone hydrolase family protein [Leptolyngbyaceae cyanobacterium SL_5_9]NJO74664.1 dienelactone hydrolase family protein [Leptolyngbyaceae cyanobacterium RM1_406_9]
MRRPHKLFGIAIVTMFLVLLWALFNPMSDRSLVAQEPSQNYASRLMESHRADLPVASEAVAYAPATAVETEEVTYATIDGTPVTGYLARPAEATEPLPALIVIHEWWGLNDNIRMMTERLAGEGYTALAVDLYNGEFAEDPQTARSLVDSVSQNPQLAQENLRQAYQYLEGEQSATAIASLGWCFGGSWSLNTALLLPDQLDAAVIYYGGQLETDPARLSGLEMPILGIFGALDDNPPVETVREFEAALQSLDKSVEIYVYPGADHAFANPSGMNYDPEAAEDAWERTTAFLEQHLK